MNNGPVRYGNAYSPYPYGNPDNNANASTTSISSLASTSSKVLGIFKSKNKDRAPPVPEKDYPYIGGRNALPSTSSVSITLSDAGTTASSSYSSTTGKARERAAGLFKIGKKSKKNAERDLQVQQATISGPWNVKHEIHIDDGLKGFPPEWQNSLLQLGYSPEEIQQMMEKKRRNPSVSAISVGAGNSAPSSNASSSTHRTTGSTSTSAHYNYPTPPQQYALPVPSQYSSSAYQPLTLQTDTTPAFGDLDQQLPSRSRTNSPATYAPQLRNHPERSDSPASSIRSGQRSLAGDPRASPVPSLSREHVLQPSNLASQSSNPFKAASPSRPVPPPPLFPESSISIQKANNYKPLKVIAVNGDESGDENEPFSNVKAAVNSTARIEQYQQHGRFASTSTTASRGSADPPAATRKAPSKPSISSLSNVTVPSAPSPASPSATNQTTTEGPPRLSLGIPRISLSLGNLDLGAGLDLGGIKENSDEAPSQTVEWSESLFAALPSATAFGGFRASVIRSPASAHGSSGRGSPASNYNGVVGESAARASPGANSPFAWQSPTSYATSPLTGSTLGQKDVPLRSLAQSREPSPTTMNTAQKTLALVASVSAGAPFTVRAPSPAASRTPESSKPTVGFNTATSPNQQQNHEPHPTLPSPSSSPNGQAFPANRRSIASSDSTLSPGKLHHDRDLARESVSTYSTRESISSFGEMDYDDGDGEHEEETVVVARATAVTLARAPSMALHRNFDVFAQGGKGTNGTIMSGNGVNGVDPGRDVVGQESAQAFNVRARGLSDAPPYAALQAQRMLYQNAGFDEDEDEDEDDEEDSEEENESGDEDDPDSRYTIRLGDADAGRLMDAVMRGGGVLSEEQQNDLNAAGFGGDAKRDVGGRQLRPLSTATITKEARKEERPTSTATIQGAKIASPILPNGERPGDSLDVEVADVEAEGEEDSSALDDWLDANDSDDPDTVSPSTEDKAVTISPSKGEEGSEYDDADHPLLDAYTSLDPEDDRLEGEGSRRSPESSYEEENSRDSTYSIDSAYTDETASQSPNNRQSVLTTNSGQIVTAADVIPDSPFVLTPGQMSAVSSQGTRKRGSSKSSQTSAHERTPGAGSGSGSRTAGSYRPQRSSMIYAPGIKGSSNAFEPIASTNHMSPGCREILKPLISFIRLGDPCSIYCGLQQVAEGESGGIFAAQALSGKSQTRVAIKKVRVEEKNRSKIDTLRREMRLFSRIKHENMLTYGEMWLAEDAQPELWIRMDLMERSLADFLGLLPEGLVLEERHVARFAMDVASGLAYLERLFIAHRDIRSDNLLVSTGGCIKLADFANAVQLAARNTQRTDEVGIVYWQAPEMRRGSYDAMKVDVWSLGATVWELIEGETPFENDPSGPHDRLPELTNIQEVSQGLLGFLHLCEMPPTRRPSARELLQTPFIRASCSRTDVVQVLSRAKILEEAVNSG